MRHRRARQWSGAYSPVVGNAAWVDELEVAGARNEEGEKEPKKEKDTGRDKEGGDEVPEKDNEPASRKRPRVECISYPANACKVCYRERNGTTKITGYTHYRSDTQCRKHMPT